VSIKNIIWDWNGTIVNDAWVFVDVMNSVLKKNHLLPTTLKHYRQNFCFPIQNYWRGLGFQFTDGEFGELNASFIQEYKKKMFLPKLHRGLEGLLKDLKKQNLKQFVLSASEDGLLKKSVKYYHLEFFFNAIYGVDNLNAFGKEELGQRLCAQHKILYNETLFIGDTEYDYRVASALGCEVVLVSHGHINHRRLLQTGETVVRSVKELKEYFKLNQ